MSDTELYIYIGLTFLLSFILGFLCCFFLNRSKDKSRMVDELIRVKRELYNQKRMLADFFNTSNTLFEQLENSYQAYSAHMNEHARKMFPMLGDIYVTTKHEHTKTHAENMNTKPTITTPEENESQTDNETSIQDAN